MSVAKPLDQALLGLDRLLIVLTVICLVMLVGVVFAAVVMRYVLDSPLIFSFDLSTLFFAWIVFIGLMLADRDDAHMGLELVPLLNSVLLQKLVILFRQLIVLSLCIYLAWIGYQLTMRTGAQISSLRISSRWLYSSMPIGFGLMALSYLGRLARHLSTWNR